MSGSQASVAAKLRETAKELRDEAQQAGLPLLVRLLSIVILEAESFPASDGRDGGAG
jgi:hypothetical protein